MTNGRGDDSHVPVRRVVLPPRRIEESWAGANDEKADKLRRNRLRRQARTRGFELRHTSYGYALIDGARNRVDGRNDLTLDDVESLLSRG